MRRTKAKPSAKPSTKSNAPIYTITAHTVVHDDSSNSQLDNYVIVYGSEVLKVQYSDSQIRAVKPGASELEQVTPGKDDSRSCVNGIGQELPSAA